MLAIHLLLRFPQTLYLPSSLVILLSTLSISGSTLAVERQIPNPVFNNIYELLDNGNTNVVVSGSCHGNGSDHLNIEHNTAIPMGYNVRPQNQNAANPAKFKDSTATLYCQLLGFDGASDSETAPLQDSAIPLSYQNSQSCSDSPENTVMIIKNKTESGNYGLQWNYYQGIPEDHEWSLDIFTSITCSSVPDTDLSNLWQTTVNSPKASLIYDQIQEDGRSIVAGNCASLYPEISEDLDNDTIALGFSKKRNNVYRDKNATLDTICRASGYQKVLDSSYHFVAPSLEYSCNQDEHLLFSIFDSNSEAVRIVQKPRIDRGWYRYEIDSVHCTNPDFAILSSTEIHSEQNDFGISVADIGTTFYNNTVVTVLATTANDTFYHATDSDTLLEPSITLTYLDSNLNTVYTSILNRNTPNWAAADSAAGEVLDSNGEVVTRNLGLIGVEGLGDLDGSGSGVFTIAVGADIAHGVLYLINLSNNGSIIYTRRIDSTLFTDTLTDIYGPLYFGSAIANLGNLFAEDKITLAISAKAHTLDNDDAEHGDGHGSIFLVTFNPTNILNPSYTISDDDFSTIEILPTTEGINLQHGSHFGSSIAALGDIDGEGPGVGAIAVGAPGLSFLSASYQSSRGIYILNFNAEGTIINNIHLSSDTEGLDIDETFTALGTSVAFLGDFDFAGDGYITLAVALYHPTHHIRIVNVYKNGRAEVRYNISNEVENGPSYGINDNFGFAIANLDKSTKKATELTTLAITAFDDDTVHLVTLGAAGAADAASDEDPDSEEVGAESTDSQ